MLQVLEALVQIVVTVIVGHQHHSSAGASA
jgi:hypothetical protein